MLKLTVVWEKSNHFRWTLGDPLRITDYFRWVGSLMRNVFDGICEPDIMKMSESQLRDCLAKSPSRCIMPGLISDWLIGEIIHREHYNLICSWQWTRYAFCMVFHVRWNFLTTSLRIPPESLVTRVGFGDEWWEIHLAWKTIQNAFSRIFYTLRHFNQVAAHENHVRWIYLTTVLCMGKGQKYARTSQSMISMTIRRHYHMRLN